MTESTHNSSSRHKVLLLDDDPDVLELYQEMLLQLPSRPEVQIATSGARAMSLLESQPFNLLISDLKMPKMDGLQVLAIVRRKFPALRTVVLTGVPDEQLRARAYAMGIDLFLEKPAGKKELTFLLDCIESLLGQEALGGFRGIQSKSLVDIIQLECLSGSSAVLKITNAKSEGRIWIQNGEVIDAATEGSEGEEAFRRILGWRTGNFELQPADPEHERKIKASYQGLLLDTAQAIDEAQATQAPAPTQPGSKEEAGPTLGRIHGLEFALRIRLDEHAKLDHWGGEDPEHIAAWVRNALATFEKIGDRFHFGHLESVTASGPQRHIHIMATGTAHVVAGIIGSFNRGQVEETGKKLLETWVS